MRERPILFNTEMVMALLNGTKTCTRRVVRYKYSNTEMKIKKDKYGARLIEIQKDVKGEKSDGSTYHKLLPFVEKEAPYQPGDILYVRETWCKGSYGNEKEKYYYKADDNNFFCTWHPSIHMPKEAARIWLKVTDVKAERLQDMDKMDAVKEGIDPRLCINLNHALAKFKKLWDSTIKKSDLDRYGWDANPYVWVIEFERCGKRMQVQSR